MSINVKANGTTKALTETADIKGEDITASIGLTPWIQNQKVSRAGSVVTVALSGNAVNAITTDDWFRLGTLPVGMRPASPVYAEIDTGGGVAVYSDGVIQAFTKTPRAAGAWIGYATLTFVATQ